MNIWHGTYLGYKFQLGFNELPEEEQVELKNWVYDTLFSLYQNEEKYTELVYGEVGWTEDVNTFVRYNANKALTNLGFEPLFPDTAEDVNPIVMNGISTGTSNHDFFSQVGNGYLVGQVKPMEDEDYSKWSQSKRKEQRLAYRKARKEAKKEEREELLKQQLEDKK